MVKTRNRFPEKFLEKITAIFPSGILNQVLPAFALKRDTTFRINLNKITRQDALREFKSNNIKVKDINWYSDAFILISPELEKLAGMSLYRDGKIYVQNLSSMLPVIALNPKPSDSVLDLAAAPGSKTTQLASWMGNTGRIVALEKDEVRYEKLAANLRLQGASNVEVRNIDALGIWREYFESFDKVLLDSPCTSEGRFNSLRPKTYLYWNQLKVKRMAKKQKGLIMTAFKCLKPGGSLLYSTCTFSPEENEFVVNYLLKRFPENCMVEEISLNIKNRLPGLKSWNDTELDSSLKRCIRVVPTQTMEGFFLCLIRKTKSLQQL